MTTQNEFAARRAEQKLQRTADLLFAACMQFLIAKEDVFLEKIRDLSQELLDSGYETKFEHRRRALVVRSMFNQMAIEVLQREQDQLVPRIADAEELPDAS